MQTELILIFLFSLQSILNIGITIWGVKRLIILERQIIQNKEDIDNLGMVIRRNKAIADGKLTRFICEVASKFRMINQDSAFTYPPAESENDL